jgi:Family of unknown function (DUF6463)
MTMNKPAGRLLTAIGIIHTLFTPVFFARELGAIAADGVIASVAEQYDRNAAFWFAFFGFVLILLGETIHVIERELASTVPPRVTWGLAAVILTGIVVMPVSGLWLGLVPVFLLVRGTPAVSLRAGGTAT